MKLNLKIKPPNRKETITIWVLVFFGVLGMGFFIRELLFLQNSGNSILFVLFFIGIVTLCLRMVAEWYYYLFIKIPQKRELKNRYSVDVFTTYCECEPKEMLLKTLEAIQELNYPHETYLCDESNDPSLKSYCQKRGIHHITRTVKNDAKAGNINNALSCASGDICLIIDPDHVPPENLLDEILPFFDDNEMGYVQIVQAYSNTSESTIAKGAAQQTYQFYGPMMMCMNSYGTVQAIGANCVFRRTALDSIGGHAAGLAEDMHTAVKLQAKKWKSIYIPWMATFGLVPSSLTAYYKQQLKWSKGTWDILFSTYPKVFFKLSFKQKLHYLLLGFNYFSGFIYLINLLIPVLALFSNQVPLVMDILDFLIYSSPIIVSTVLVRLFVQKWVFEENERGMHAVGGLLLIGTWWIYILGFIYALIGKKVPYIPTPKDSNEEDNWLLNLPNLIVIFISIVSVIYGVIIDFNPFLLFMATLAMLNVFILSFTVFVSRQGKLRKLRSKKPFLNASLNTIQTGKEWFWLFRHKIYRGIRKVVVPISLVFIGLLIVHKYQRTTLSKIDENLYRNIYESWQADSMCMKKEANSYRIEKVNWNLPKQNVQRRIWPDFTDVGVNYRKGYHWFRNYHNLTNSQLEADFDRIKGLGLTSIKRIGLGIYDHAIFKVAKNKDVKVHYSFWVSPSIDFINNHWEMDQLKSKILKTVRKFENEEAIVSWNLTPDIFASIARGSVKQKNKQQKAYYRWLSELTQEIYLIDERPLSVDVEYGEYMEFQTGVISEKLQAISGIGIIVPDTLMADIYLPPMNMDMFFSSIPIHSIDTCLIKGSFIQAWQDNMTKTYVTFDGILDLWGSTKKDYYNLDAMLSGSQKDINSDSYRILKPAKETVAGKKMNYQVLKHENGKWRMVLERNDAVQFKWYLIHKDIYGNPIHLQYLDKGRLLKITIPKNPKLYELYLSVNTEQMSQAIRTELHWELVDTSELVRQDH